MFSPALLAAAVVMLNDNPPPLVEMAPAQKAVIVAEYTCPGHHVRLGLQDRDGRVSVTEYKVDGKDISASDLAIWNSWLAGFSKMEAHYFSCQMDDNQSITVIGLPRPGANNRVMVHWQRGRLTGPYPRFRADQ